MPYQPKVLGGLVIVGIGFQGFEASLQVLPSFTQQPSRDTSSAEEALLGTGHNTASFPLSVCCSCLPEFTPILASKRVANTIGATGTLFACSPFLTTQTSAQPPLQVPECDLA